MIETYNSVKAFVMNNSLTRINPNFELDRAPQPDDDIVIAAPEVDFGDKWSIKKKKQPKVPQLDQKYVQTIEINTVLKIIEEVQEKQNIR